MRRERDTQPNSGEKNSNCSLLQEYRRYLQDKSALAKPETQERMQEIRTKLLRDFNPISPSCDRTLSKRYVNYSHAMISLMGILSANRNEDE